LDHLTVNISDALLRGTGRMTADVYTVWPLGWKKVSWNLERVEDNTEEPTSEF